MLLAGSDPELERRAIRAGFSVRHVTFTPVDAAAAGKVRHFETYNRTAAAQQVADIVAAAQADAGRDARGHPGLRPGRPARQCG